MDENLASSLRNRYSKRSKRWCSAAAAGVASAGLLSISTRSMEARRRSIAPMSGAVCVSASACADSRGWSAKATRPAAAPSSLRLMILWYSLGTPSEARRAAHVVAGASPRRRQATRCSLRPHGEVPWRHSAPGGVSDRGRDSGGPSCGGWAGRRTGARTHASTSGRSAA